MSLERAPIIDLPSQASALLAMATEDIAAWYRTLALAPLHSVTALTRWLRDWSRADELVEEARHLALIAATRDTGDREAAAAHRAFESTVVPAVRAERGRLVGRFLERGMPVNGLEHVVRCFRADLQADQPEVLRILSAAEAESANYQERMGAVRAESVEGQVALGELAVPMRSPDRICREAAWRAEADALGEVREEIGALYLRLVAQRNRAARAAGCGGYRELVWLQRHRFDYEPSDTAAVRAAIQSHAVPALRRLHRARRERLGVPTLRPWDLPAPLRDTNGTPTATDLSARTQRLMTHLDPVLGQWYHRLDAGQLVDVGSHPDKASMSYCATLYARRLSFIFVNAPGELRDMPVMLHECGHAFHDLAAAGQPYLWQRRPPAESSELASMVLEHLALARLGELPDVADRATADHLHAARLEDALHLLVHAAAVDAFQEWVYDGTPDRTVEELDRAWVDFRRAGEQELDWSGLESARPLRWLRQMHLFRHPFYYIEYALAQLGALDVWASTGSRPDAALGRYRRALTLGSTTPAAEVYRTMGTRLIPGSDRIQRLVGHAEEEWRRLVKHG